MDEAEKKHLKWKIKHAQEQIGWCNIRIRQMEEKRERLVATVKELTEYLEKNG